MGCNTCKKTKQDVVDEVINVATSNSETTGKKVSDYIKKVILFILLVVVLTPIMIPVFIYVLFRLVVLSKQLNLLPVVYYIGKKIFKDDDDDDDDEEEEDDEEPNEDDYELVDPNELIEIK